MQDILIDLINDYGYWGILALICIENLFPPIPSEVVLIFGGFVTTYSNLNMWGVVAFATAGSLIGAAVLFMIGRVLNKDRLKVLISGKIGKALRLKPADVDSADRWFAKYEYKAVFLCRCVPIVRSLISIPAGISKMKTIPFFSLTLAGSLIWNTLLVGIGVLTGGAWEQSLRYFSWYSKVALILIGIAALIIACIYVKKLRARKTDSAKMPSDLTDDELKS
ncbi:MAG: DedA family protein [Oscillospiraceae bacterium]